jgi:hypothetical protein
LATVMWDHDGVISDWVGNFYPWICDQEGWVQTEWEIWHHYRNHEMHDAEFVERLKQYAAEGGFGEHEIFPDVRDAVRRIKAAGHSQHVVTDRPDAAHADTAWWMHEYLPEIDTLTFGRDKTVFKDYGDGPYFALDDRIENVQAMCDAGISAVLMDRPWNRDSYLPRVYSADEFADAVLALASGS